MRKALYGYLAGLNDEATHTEMQHAALATPSLLQAVKKAIDDHRSARPEDGAVSYSKDFPAELIKPWQPPADLRYPHSAVASKPPGYAYSLYVNPKSSGPEEVFERHLMEAAEAGHITWWWKNGDRGREYFAVPYRWNDGWHLFYPDYLVEWSNATLGIYEVKKAGDPQEPTASKAAGLAQWMTSHPPSGRSIEFGICVEYPDHGGWYQHNGIGYSAPPKDRPDGGGGWKPLPFDR